MQHLLLKTCVAGACALGFVAFNQPAKAFSPPVLDETRQLVIQVQDMEDEAVDSALESEIYPPGPKEGEMSEDEMMAPKEDEAADDMGEMKDE